MTVTEAKVASGLLDWVKLTSMSDLNLFSEDDSRLPAIRMEKTLDMGLFSNRDMARTLVDMLCIRLYRTGAVNTYGSGCYDPKREYVQNSDGFRGSEEFKQADIIATGCSQTFGIGIEESAMWSKVMGNALGMSSVATIAAPGWSIQEMVSSTMEHIRKYGKPKVIAALLPDFGRTVMLEDSSLLVRRTDSDATNGTSAKLRTAGFHFGGTDVPPKISKAPHLANDVIPTEYAVFLAGQTWAGFIEYCRQAEIKLVWTSWSTSVKEMYKALNYMLNIEEVNHEFRQFDFSGYVVNPFDSLEKRWIIQLESLGCHKDIADKYPDSFRVGTDLCDHYGAHAHAHIGEMLADKYLELM